MLETFLCKWYYLIVEEQYVPTVNDTDGPRGSSEKRDNMKYVEIKAIEINSMDDDVLQDSIIFGVDETITKPEEVPAVLRKILKKYYNIASFGQEVNKDPILFGKEMDEIEEKYLNEYGIYTLDIQEIKVNWENGMPI